MPKTAVDAGFAISSLEKRARKSRHRDRSGLQSKNRGQGARQYREKRRQETRGKIKKDGQGSPQGARLVEIISINPGDLIV